MREPVEIALFTDDLEAAKSFYGRLVGAAPEAEWPGGAIFAVGALKLLVHERAGAMEDGPPNEDHFAVGVTADSARKVVLCFVLSTARGLRREPFCALARVEVVRAVSPHAWPGPVLTARKLLDEIDLVQLDDELLDLAGELSGPLRRASTRSISPRRSSSVRRSRLSSPTMDRSPGRPRRSDSRSSRRLELSRRGRPLGDT